MNSGAIWVVMPVKRFASAKSRLSSVLSHSERAELACAMTEDVLDVAMSCRSALAGIVVVTSEDTAADAARARGAEVMIDAYDDGINVAVRQALAGLERSSDVGVIVVPSDIPHLTCEAVMRAVAALSRTDVLAIASAARDGGTNLLACRPAGAMPLNFGPFSFDRHCQAARAAGLSIELLDAPELALDIDCPEDLPPFLALNTPTRTHALLSRRRIGWAARAIRDGGICPSIALTEA